MEYPLVFGGHAEMIFRVFLMRTLLGGGLDEELGWRRFVLPHLSERYDVLRGTLIIIGVDVLAFACSSGEYQSVNEYNRPTSLHCTTQFCLYLAV